MATQQAQLIEKRWWSICQWDETYEVHFEDGDAYCGQDIGMFDPLQSEAEKNNCWAVRLPDGHVIMLKWELELRDRSK